VVQFWMHYQDIKMSTLLCTRFTQPSIPPGLVNDY